MTVTHLECPDACSLKPGTHWSDRFTECVEGKLSHRQIVAAASADGYILNTATVSRHKKHMVLGDAFVPEPKPATNIEILESIISRGYANRKNWKPTITDTMKAMDMWFRLTQGNPFDELLDTLAAAAVGDENAAAKGTVAEQEEIIDA